MILSSLRSGLAIPRISTALQFQRAWEAAERTVPVGWTTWNAAAGSAEQLLIERVNLESLYKTDPALVTLTFNTTEATATSSYSFRLPGATTDSGPYAIVPSRTFAPGTILTLYSNGTPNYTYAVGTVARTFDLKGSSWTPQP